MPKSRKTVFSRILDLQMFPKQPHPVSVQYLFHIPVPKPTLDHDAGHVAHMAVIGQIRRKKDVNRRQGHSRALVDEELAEVEADAHQVDRMLKLIDEAVGRGLGPLGAEQRRAQADDAAALGHAYHLLVAAVALDVEEGSRVGVGDDDLIPLDKRS